ncbi:MAG: hypothetical protein ACKO2G_12110, partial [Verrucomicrobiales bacterium]
MPHGPRCVSYRPRRSPRAARLLTPALRTTLPNTPMPHTLPPLPYALDALEPHIDAKTMEIH